MVYLFLKLGVLAAKIIFSSYITYFFQVAQNSEHILIYICNELVLGIIISTLQMDA